MLIEMPDQTLGRNILILRKKYKLSRTALGKLTGISVYTLKDWEEESVNPIISFEQLKRISAIFDIPSAELVHKNINEIATSGFQPSSQ